MKLSIDFETASTVNLRRVGAAAYAAHPDTRILCMAWAFDQDKVEIWLPRWSSFPKPVQDHVGAGGMVAGWSLQFEYHIWNTILRNQPPLIPEQLDDTQARAAYFGFPLALEDAGAVLHMPIQKDKVGHALMLRMSRPRSLSPLTWWHQDDLPKYYQLGAYCRRDVEAERAIANKLPPLPSTEQKVWLEDFRANARGIAVDIDLTRILIELSSDARLHLDSKLQTLTNGEVPATTNATRLLAYVNARETRYPLPDLRKPTVDQALALPLLPHVRDVLKLRQAAAKTSIAKLPVLLDASIPEPASNARIIRGLLAYYGAQRTGRWAGRLLQPQNLPRGVIKDEAIDQALDVIFAGAEPEDLELLFGKPGVGALDIVIALIRSCLIARPGQLLVVADFSQIEARVIAWLAGQNDLLEIFRKGEDVYTHTARSIGSSSRQLGKVLVLACDFGQGHVRFQVTARGYGLELTIDECLDAVTAWREANWKIVDLWYAYDRAVKLIAGHRSASPQYVGAVMFERVGVDKTMMRIQLPSGRALYYHDIRLEKDEQNRDVIVYSGVHQLTKRWESIRTYGAKIAENVTQATARDVMRDIILSLPVGLRLLLTIHDELICEALLADAARGLALLLVKMRVTPRWAPGLPVGAAGWVGARYKKG